MTQTRGVELIEEVKEAVNTLEAEYKGRMHEVNPVTINKRIAEVLDNLFSRERRGIDKKIAIKTLLEAEVRDRIRRNRIENPRIQERDNDDDTTPILIMLAGALLVANYMNTPGSGKLGKRKSRRRRNKKKKGTKRRRTRKN